MLEEIGYEYKVVNIDLNKAKYFAGHSLGEYSALCCADSLNFEQTIDLLKHRGNAMQNAVPKNEGGMVAVLGEDIKDIKIIIKIRKNFSMIMGIHFQKF